MNNLIEIANEAVQRIEQGAELKAQVGQVRGYVGMSEIGGDCPRQIQLKRKTRKKPSVPYKAAAAFEVGNVVEDIIIKWLRYGGYEVEGCQEHLQDFGGMFAGHPDGIIKGLVQDDTGLNDAVLEIKTAKQEIWREISKQGVKAIYPKYYSQAQCYMHYKGLKYTLFVVFNKNTSALHCEIVEYDEPVFKDARTTAKDIIESDELLPIPLGLDPDSPPCSWCAFKGKCWDVEDVF